MMPEHELTPDQEEKVKKLSSTLKFLAIGFGVVAAGHAVALAEHLFARDEGVQLLGVPMLMMMKNVLVFGIVFKSITQAADEFETAAKSHGNDMTNIMNGIQKLTTGLGKIKVPLLIMGATALFENLKSFKN